MLSCGHQFHVGDDCDWLISSSAVRPVNGNSASNILHNLLESHCKTERDEPHGELHESKSDSDKLDLSFYLKSGGSYSETEEVELRKAPALILEAREMQLSTPCRKYTGTCRTAKRDYTENVYSSDDFEENDKHMDDCPIKWYCRKKTKNGWGPCIALKRHDQDKRSQSGKKFRDRIPLEVKIGKISLNKRENEMRFMKRHEGEPESYKKFEINPKVLEMQKKRLEAKLNWRPFQDSNDDDDDEDEDDSHLSQDFNSRDGYLRPRMVIGSKSPVSILLFPYQQQSNCSCGTSDKAPKIRLERASSAIQSTKPSIQMEISRPVKIFRPKTTQSIRWSSKPQKSGKRLQLPKQMNIFFDAPIKCVSNNLPGTRKHREKTVKRSGEEVRKAQSLTSLYYKLEDKSNSGKTIDDEYLEKMIRELSMEDNLRGIKKILNPGFPVKKKRFKEKNSRECHNLAQWSDDEHFKIICKQIKFSQRRS